MDIMMPESRGIKIIAQLLQACPHTRVLVLTMHEDPAYVRWVLAAEDRHGEERAFARRAIV
jgi:two-component system, NarL family, invasion response regulator UvrY